MRAMDEARLCGVCTRNRRMPSSARQGLNGYCFLSSWGDYDD
jgi:hypothetical protein